MLESEEDTVLIYNQGSQTEGCVVIMVVFTIFTGLVAVNGYSTQFFSLAMALGLSSIAIAILHLAKVLQESR